MAIFNKNTLTQVSGFNNQIFAGELVWNQVTYWNVSFTNSSTQEPVDLTGATIDAQIIRRALSNVRDSRYGLTFDIADVTPAPDSIPLTVTNIDAGQGYFTLEIDSTAWDLINSDPELEINAVDPVGFSGRIKVTQPASGSTPQNDLIMFLLFIVRSDGIVVE
jgi:hypothetical protein